MNRYLLLISLALYSTLNFAQKDSIVNYLDMNNKIIDNDGDIKRKTRLIEVITNQNDSLWLVQRYRRNGKLRQVGYYRTKDKKMPIGKFVSYNRRDSISNMIFYNTKGLKHGKIESWFYNRNKKLEGVYLENKKEGVWKYYHQNGQIAARHVYKSDSILRAIYFDENGHKIKYNGSHKFIEPQFKGGNKLFSRKLKKTLWDIQNSVKGVVYISFTINVEGNIEDVEIDNKNLPSNVKYIIINRLEGVKGWQPASHLNRKLPYDYLIPLIFNLQ